MKKIIIVFIILSLSLVLTIHLLLKNQESTENTENISIVQSVWYKLDESERNEVVGSWKDGLIEEVVIESGEGRFHISPEYYGKVVYLITFESAQRDLIGDVQRLVDRESKEIIGFNFRD